jgi:uncharacterized protein (TIGR02594 family)
MLNASWIRAQSRAIGIEGTIPPPPEAVDMATRLVNSTPTDYVRAMEFLADLDKSGLKGPDGRPYNQRWPTHANPLLVAMWRDVGYKYATNDCMSWCGVSLGWCLKRSGRDIPKDCASSQAYLDYGTLVEDPIPGDIVVFTNYGDEGHGHVTLFRGVVAKGRIKVLGGNQQLSGATNCPSGFPISVIDEREMDTDTRHSLPSGKVTGHYVHRYIRPPAPTRAPAKPSGPVVM